MSSVDGHVREFKKKWEKIANFFLLFLLLGVVVSLVVAIWHLATISTEKYIIAWGVAAFFIAVGIPISLHAIHLNVMYYRHTLQRQYIRILFIIPIYSFESWLALRFNQQSIYLETMRACYEAYIIFSLFSLLREFIGDTPAKCAAALERLGAERRCRRSKIWHHARRNGNARHRAGAGMRAYSVCGEMHGTQAQHTHDTGTLCDAY